MLTRLVVRNFKRFDEIDVELGNRVVLIGPNNCGKSTALQALALWDIGLRRWNEKRGGKETAKKRPGVAINRRDLTAIPIPSASLLWRDLRTRNVQRVEGKTQTQNIRIDIIVEGVTEGRAWRCGLEFDYANDESVYCRPLRTAGETNASRMPVPEEASRQRVALLPPMSGLAATEPKWGPGRVNVLIGEGQTAQVLRNVCHEIARERAELWDAVCGHIHGLFGVDLDKPEDVVERGELTMTYRERSGVRFDLLASGRGMQQTLLLLAFLYQSPGAVLLLDEPDAHLEILRQRQIYQQLNDVADEMGSQIIAASHSEVLLNEAAGRDLVIAFVGSTPHRIDDRGSQVLKSLRQIGFDQYYQAEAKGWVLYLEGPSDLAVLQAFARRLGHPAQSHLERPFIDYVGNNPAQAYEHFYGLQEAKDDLVGVAVYDNLGRDLEERPSLRQVMWRRNEIENYLCAPDALYAYAESSAQRDQPGPLFAYAEAKKRREVMKECVENIVPPVALRDRNDRWWSHVKASDDYLDRVFEAFFDKIGLPNLMPKNAYHSLAELVPEELIDPEIAEKLDAICEVAEKASPAGE